MNKHILTLFLSLTLLLSLAACGGNADTTDARRDANEIVVGIAQDLENSLDPYTSVTAANREVLFNVFEGLVKPDADGNLSPAVAERWGGLRRPAHLYVPSPPRCEVPRRQRGYGNGCRMVDRQGHAVRQLGGAG